VIAASESGVTRVSPDPSGSATYTSPGPAPDVAVRSNAMWVPSRDQVGFTSVCGPVTIAVESPVAGFAVKMSPPFA